MGNGKKNFGDCVLKSFARPFAVVFFQVIVCSIGATLAQPPESLPPPGRDAQLENPTPEARAKEARLIDEVFQPELILHVEPTRSKVVRTKVPVTRVAITHPEVLEVTQFGVNDFELIGRRSGETTLSIWFTDDDGTENVIRYLVRVSSNLASQQRADLEYGQLQNRINEMFPNSQVQLIPLMDKLIVRGQARDSEAATQIMSVIRGQYVNQAGTIFGFNPIAGGNVGSIPGAEDLPSARVINLLTVPGEQQVMLKVRIAELTRSAIRELGVDFGAIDGRFMIESAISNGANISAILDAGDYHLFIKAFASNGNGKILAEPTLVTLNGRTATFIAGGEFAVPTAVGIGGIGAASTSFRGFGTQLAFTPTIIDKDRIRLQVAPSFSSLDRGNTVDGIPGLTTRAVSTTVDLREGQWLAIAGLIQDEQGGSRARVPYLGDVPVLGTIFGNQKVNRNETELVVLVSPELVHPMECEQVPFILPGMNVTEPTNHAFYWEHQIEGDPGVDHRSTVWPVYQHRIHQAIREAKRQAKRNGTFISHQDVYISGPHGLSE
ncbi:MAG: pilus assembly protein N-terminal domain-containing protein [Pirellulaceae bacterium]